jgi:hypothetical protein
MGTKASTVNAHIKRIFRKLGVHSRKAALQKCFAPPQPPPDADTGPEYLI